MADAEDQQNFVAHNGDEVPDDGLDEVHNGLQYQVHDKTLGHQPYQVQDQNLEPHQFEVQNPALEPQQYAGQLQYQDYQVQDQADEGIQDQPQDELQYEPQDQEQYQLQNQAHGQAHYQVEGEAQDQEQYQMQDQAHGQAQYQVEGEAQDHNGDEVQDQVEGELGVPEHVESLQKPEPEGDTTLGGEEKRWCRDGLERQCSACWFLHRKWVASLVVKVMSLRK